MEIFKTEFLINIYFHLHASNRKIKVFAEITVFEILFIQLDHFYSLVSLCLLTS